MPESIGFCINFHSRQSGYKKHLVAEALAQVARANGIEAPRPEHIRSNPADLAALHAGDTVVCNSITDLCDEITKLGPTIRSLVGNGVRVVSAETPDVVGSLRLIEAIAAQITSLEKEVKQLRAAERSAEVLVEEASAEIAARTIDRLDHAIRALNIGLMAEEYGHLYLKERKRLNDTRTKAKEA